MLAEWQSLGTKPKIDIWTIKELFYLIKAVGLSLIHLVCHIVWKLKRENQMLLKNLAMSKMSLCPFSDSTKPIAYLYFHSNSHFAQNSKLTFEPSKNFFIWLKKLGFHCCSQFAKKVESGSGESKCRHIISTPHRAHLIVNN